LKSNSTRIQRYSGARRISCKEACAKGRACGDGASCDGASRDCGSSDCASSGCISRSRRGECLTWSAEYRVSIQSDLLDVDVLESFIVETDAANMSVFEMKGISDGSGVGGGDDMTN